MAQLADQEGQSEQAAVYRYQAQEAFARFEGNRHRIDQRYGGLIATIASVARGRVEAKAEAEAKLQQLEAEGWRVTEAVEEIWKGERNLVSLTRNLSEQDALLVRRVLESLSLEEADRYNQKPSI